MKSFDVAIVVLLYEQIECTGYCFFFLKFKNPIPFDTSVLPVASDHIICSNMAHWELSVFDYNFVSMYYILSDNDY